MKRMKILQKTRKHARHLGILIELHIYISTSKKDYCLRIKKCVFHEARCN